MTRKILKPHIGKCYALYLMAPWAIGFLLSIGTFEFGAIVIIGTLGTAPALMTAAFSHAVQTSRLKNVPLRWSLVTTMGYLSACLLMPFSLSSQYNPQNTSLPYFLAICGTAAAGVIYGLILRWEAMLNEEQSPIFKI